MMAKTTWMKKNLPDIMRLMAIKDHHSSTLELFSKLEELDFQLYDDYFCWEQGVAGDNGEVLMKQLDIIFRLQDLKRIKEG